MRGFDKDIYYLTIGCLLVMTLLMLTGCGADKHVASEELQCHDEYRINGRYVVCISPSFHCSQRKFTNKLTCMYTGEER